MSVPRLLITGANGLIGKFLCAEVVAGGFTVCGSIRETYNLPLITKQNVIKKIAVGEINNQTDWKDAVTNCDVVIHLAARVHVMSDVSTNPLEEYRKVNTEGTLNLARQAAAKGVKRFIFISSIKVNGEFTTSASGSFKADDVVAPIDPYAVSKYEAEMGLKEIALKTGMEIVIIRPPLVYGPGVKANFLKIMSLVKRGFPLPFGLIKNKRSLVSIDNLVSLIITCIDHPMAKNEVFLVSDGEDLSTSALLRKIASAMNKKIFLIPVPTFILVSLAYLLGQKKISQRLCGSMQVDISKTTNLLNWKPVITVDKAIKKTVEEI